LTRTELDICDATAVEALLEQIRPWAVINAAGFVNVDAAETHGDHCFDVNVGGARTLAQAAQRHALPFLAYSSDLVFGGEARTPYTESSPTAPLCVYGRSKEAMEKAVLCHEKTLCVRTAAFFGAWGRGDFLIDALTALQRGDQVFAMSDVVVSPTYLPDLVEASLDLLLDECTGIYHLTNRGAISWADFARQAAAALGIESSSLRAVPQSGCTMPARRPAYSVLESRRALMMPTLQHALARFAQAAHAKQGSDWLPGGNTRCLTSLGRTA
jgi:dTDP-4-dehydrorhamnose reductase